jgi:nucleotide-binding universal stress UspA family protein
MAAPLYLVGVDGSSAGAAALRFAAALSAGTGARLEVVRVVGDVPLAPELGDQARVEADVVRAAEMDTVRAVDAAGLDATVDAITGDPAHELHRRARARDAALIVIGATHRGRLGRLAPGSLGEQLVHGAPCGVLVVPDGWERDRIRRVAAAIDGRPEGDRAAECAAETALAVGAELTLVTADDPRHEMSAVPGDVLLERLRAHRAALESMLNDRRAGLDARLRTSTALVSGDPAEGIGGICAGGVDLLVVGSRGYGPLRAALVGSTSRKLVDHAPCPVLVVPRGGARSPVWAPRRPAAGSTAG